MINSVPEGMRLSKAISTTKANPLTVVRNEQGERTESGKETLETMLKTHFPGSIAITDDMDPINLEEQRKKTTKYDWITAKRVVDEVKTGKSTETALHYVVSQAEAAIDHKEICVGTFVDIEGAFDRTTFESISKAARNHGVSITLIKWIECMLKGRIIHSDLLGDSMIVKTTRGCPQGGVLSPLLWSLVVDPIIVKLNKGPYYTVGYADDLVILARGRFPATVSDIMQKALSMLEEWCDENHLSVNPGKTTVIPFTRLRKLTGLSTLTLYGQQLAWSKEVKYLGLTLDKELSWSKHQYNITMKALRVFGMCRTAYGKTWGLKPKIMKWIYLMMVRPILLYGSIVWWPRTKLKTCRVALSKLQRVACMAMTGAFRTTPTAAVEIILGIPPLHIAIETEARKALHRLAIAGLWDETRPPSKHTNLASHKDLDFITNMGCDKIPPRFVFDKKFRVSIPSRDDWKRGPKPPDENTLIWYTDGSKMESGTGAGVYSKDTKLSEGMGKLATVFQAETYAIIMCALKNVETSPKKRNIYILSDSQAALKALASVRVESKLVLNAIHALNRLGKFNKVTLMWVPGHTGVEGNEMADSLARKGSETAPIGPEPFVPISKSTIHTAFRKYAVNKHLTEWKNLPGMKHSKNFLGDNPGKWSKFILGGNRNQSRLLMGALTGHFATNKMLNRMGLVASDQCRNCGEKQETMEHVLCECDSLARTRMRLLGLAYPKLEDYRHLAPFDITKLLANVFKDAME
ncbi:hypothetical protein ABMA28_005307 [Loxostege sticticalis]|uniref:Uncharacterized protein n=2 Tax=Loxostege sticticalis TaxID=481309 RepID=A0ABD0SPZ1_LOXSC